MKAIKANVVRGLQHESKVTVCDNSGAKILKIISTYNYKSVKGKPQQAGVASMINGSVISGKPEMRKQVVMAVIVRQKKSYRRADGMRVQFEDNAVVIVKDDMGTPKGTMIKGPVAREVAERWPMVAKLSSAII